MSRRCIVIGACPELGSPVTPLPEPIHPPPISPPPPPPPPSPGSPVHGRPVAGIAAGSTAVAAVLLALVLWLVVALRRRRVSRGNVEATGDPTGPSEKKQFNVFSLNFAAAPRIPRLVDPSPPPTSSSDRSITPSAATGESATKSKDGCPRPQGVPSEKPMPAATEDVFFRGAFTYDDLAAATNGFADSNLVGSGGFGDVYVGTVDGAAVAVKRLRAGSQQGHREFQAEVRTISRVHHRNLVSLVGYCAADGGRRLLVYEFVPNMTLEHHLHGEQSILDWPTRWKIAIGTAKGLAYLHEDCHPRIVHRDIKAANILLDSDFNPKVSDFGMAKFIPGGDSHVSTTRIVGTIGYLAPEYAISGRLTEKSDVFSYGVVLLELITGMKAAISSHPDTDDTLVGWAMPLLTRALELGNYDELVDPVLVNYDTARMARLVRCTAVAVRSSARRRPRMSQIVRYLEGDTSAEEIDACGAPTFGESGSAVSNTTEQLHPVRYNEIRASRASVQSNR